MQTLFTFSVDAFVKAENKNGAKKIIEEGLFMNLNSGLHCGQTKAETKVGRLGWKIKGTVKQKIVSVEEDNSDCLESKDMTEKIKWKKITDPSEYVPLDPVAFAELRGKRVASVERSDDVYLATVIHRDETGDWTGFTKSAGFETVNTAKQWAEGIVNGTGLKEPRYFWAISVVGVKYPVVWGKTESVDFAKKKIQQFMEKAKKAEDVCKAEYRIEEWSEELNDYQEIERGQNA